jgi:hypothetical protein
MDLRNTTKAAADAIKRLTTSTRGVLVGHNPMKPIYVLCGQNRADKLKVTDLENAGKRRVSREQRRAQRDSHLENAG